MFRRSRKLKASRLQEAIDPSRAKKKLEVELNLPVVIPAMAECGHACDTSPSKCCQCFWRNKENVRIDIFTFCLFCQSGERTLRDGVAVVRYQRKK